MNVPTSGSPESAGGAPADRRVRTALELALEAALGRSSRVGPYRLVRQIGEGGFGVVWLAEQDPPLQRPVALKILKAGMDTQEVIGRFAVERQALALMDHPHIARVFDAGETDTGRPYFVMEFVSGHPITTFADEHRLSLEQRLRLFVSVCQAVQHAHQKGIIHRDLKPANILVALHDAAPFPKIIDFGIAKAITGTLTDRTRQTQLHSFLGTPVYMSPEQMDSGGLDVDTRSDIYSLGVLLYELLCGHLPFEQNVLAPAGAEALRRTIREADPPRPSHRAGAATAERRARLAHDRATDPARLAPRLRGDLDAIVLRCLEKDRGRRYATASALAAEVQAHLDGEPIATRHPGQLHRLGKFARRHKTAVAASAAVLVSLVAGLLTSSLLLVRERAAHARALAAEQAESGLRARADASAREERLAALKSRQVAQFMKEMLKGVGPGVALGQDTTLLREVLDRTTRRLELELSAEPGVATDLRDTLGVVYREIGDHANAEILLRQAVHARRQAVPLDEAALAESLHQLGGVLTARGRQTEAEQVLQEALALRRKVHGRDHPDVNATLSLIARVPWERRTLDDRERILREVLESQRRSLGPEHPDIATTLIRLAWIAMPKQEPEKAQLLQREALAMRRRLFGGNHPGVAEALSGLAQMLQVLGDFHPALEARREALLVYRRVLPPGHPQLLSAWLMFVSNIPATDAASDVALARLIATEIQQASGTGSPEAAAAKLALAALLGRNGGDAATARMMEQDALVLLAKLSGQQRILRLDTVEALDWCAFGMFLSGHPEAGLGMAEAAAKAAEQSDRALLPQTQDISRTLGCIYFSVGRMAEAATAFETAVGSPWSATNVIGPRTFLDYAWLGASYRELGRWPDSRRVLMQALRLAESKTGPAGPLPPVVGAVRFELGLISNLERKHEEAERHFRAAITDYDRMPATRRPWQRTYTRARALGGLGQALAGQKKFEEAERLVLEAYAETDAETDLLVGNRRKIRREAIAAIISTYRAWGRVDDAAAWAEKAAEL